MARQTPGRRAWLEKLERDTSAERGRGPVGCYCMRQGWTRWLVPSGSATEGAVDWREELTDEGRLVLAQWRAED